MHTHVSLASVKTKEIYIYRYIEVWDFGWVAANLSVQESRIALSSFRLLVTVVVVLAALKYGISTYFPPANQVRPLFWLLQVQGRKLFDIAEVQYSYCGVCLILCSDCLPLFLLCRCLILVLLFLRSGFARARHGGEAIFSKPAMPI